MTASGQKPMSLDRFIDMHREQFGFEAVCRVVGTTECGFLTSRGCRAAKQRPASARGIWAAKFTCVRIPKGLCDAALFTDVRTRRIVGWAVAARLPTEALPLQALEHALLCTCAEASSLRETGKTVFTSAS